MSISFSKEKMAPLKAVMALMIVAHHLTLAYGVGALSPFMKLGAPLVSLFFFVSGYGLHKSYQSKGNDYLRSFFRLRIWRVVLPALISLVAYYILLWNPSRDFIGEWKNLVIMGIPILPHSWFVVAIIAFYLGFFLSYRFLPNGRKEFGVLIMVICLMTFYIFIGYDRCWWVSSLAFPTGVFFASYENNVNSIFERRPILYWLTILLLFSGLILTYSTRQQYIWTLCYVFIPLLVALIAARLPLEKLNVRVVTFLAMISYEVYLCQGISMDLLRGRFYIQNDLLFVILVYTVTIILAWVVLFLCDCLFRIPVAPSTKL